MFLFAMLTAPAAAFALTPAEPASVDVEEQTEERVASRTIEISTVQTSMAEERSEEAEAFDEMPVQLVSWDGDFELMKASRRMRIWRSHIAYSLTVDAEGKATDCVLTEPFRMRRVSDRLCEVLMENHTFKPAHDANGQAVEGSYTSRISYQEMQERL